jgi:radical SAM protein with 4Fe4S-binding SPASM domain
LAFLDIFTSPRTPQSIFNEYEFDKDTKTAISELVKSYFLVPNGFDERAFLIDKMKVVEESIASGSLVNYLELVMSEVCNFRCTYCIHFYNLERSNRINNPRKFMTFEVAKEAVDQYVIILRHHNKKIVDINFGGGEPLLAWPVIKQVLDYCIKVYSQEFIFKFSLNTNASLITSTIAADLKKFRVEIATSLDGLREGNNQVRLTKKGKGTFDVILKGFNILAAQGYPLQGVSLTVSEYNFPYLDERIINWVVKQKMSEVRIDIDVIGMVDIPLEEVAEKLIRLKRYAKKYGIEIAGFWSRPLENLNTSPLEDQVTFCGVVRGRSICVTPSGKIYGCGYSTTEFGTLDHISSLFVPNNPYFRFVQEHLTGMKEMCWGCMIEGQCGGGCNITQEFARAAKTTKIERMCEFYRLMTRELLLEQLREEQ